MQTTATGHDRRERLPILALLAANAVSLLGNQFTLVAIPWFVLQTTGSAARTGFTGFFGSLLLLHHTTGLAYWQPLVFEIQEGGDWRRVIDTAVRSPLDFLEGDARVALTTSRYDVAARSVVVAMLRSSSCSWL